MSKQSLLLVDGDTRSLRVLEVSLRKAGFTVTPAVSVQDALDKLELHAPDLIISETTFPEGDGFELRRRVRQAPEWAEIPFIFLTAEAAIENKIRGLELGVDDYLTKPIYIKEIVTRINILLQKKQRTRFEERKDGRTRFAGRVADMPVVDVIQTIEISRKSGVIQFVGERGRQAAIYFRDGKVIDAEAGTLQGEDAVYRLLTWSEGEFEVVFRTVRRREVITTSSQGLLMEGMRRLDEWSRLLEQLPPLTHRFEIDAAELSGRLGDVPDDNNRILRLLDGKRTLLEVIDASDFGDLECLQAVSRLYFEELLVDLDHGTERKRDTGKPMPLVEVDVPTPMEEVASGPHPQPLMDTARISDASILSEEVVSAAVAQAPGDLAAEAEVTPLGVEELVESAQDHALMGSYRPSSLRLIDEAVAAAQAIEPSLFENDELPTPVEPMDFSTEDRTSAGLDARDSVPEEIGADEPVTPRPILRPRRKPPSPPPPPPIDRDDSGLRMIGSHGRDRAEASGELALGAVPPPRSQTQRELVTILPRRVTREMQAVASPSPPPSSETSQSPAPPVEPPGTRRPSTRSVQGSGVVSRAQGGPGVGAIALIAIAALLAGVAMFLWLKRAPKRETAPIATVTDAAPAPDAQLAIGPLDGGAERAADAMTVARAPDAAAASPDARLAVPDDAMVVAAVDAATPRVDAMAVAVADAAAQDPASQAKALYQEASEAIQEGSFDKALLLANSSLKLRRTARAYLVRAQALQRLDKIVEALESIDRAQEIAPDFAMVWDVRGGILWAAGRWDEAHEAYDQFLKLDPDSVRAGQIRKRLAEPH